MEFPLTHYCDNSTKGPLIFDPCVFNYHISYIYRPNISIMGCIRKYRPNTKTLNKHLGWSSLLINSGVFLL